MASIFAETRRLSDSEYADDVGLPNMDPCKLHVYLDHLNESAFCIFQKVMKTLADGLTRVGPVRLPGWGSRDSLNAMVGDTRGYCSVSHSVAFGTLPLLFSSSTYYVAVDFSLLLVLFFFFE